MCFSGCEDAKAKKHSNPVTATRDLFRFPSFMRMFPKVKLSNSGPGFFRKRRQGSFLLKVMFKSEAGDGLSAAGTGTPRAGEPPLALGHKAPSHDQPTLHLSSSLP